MDHASFFSEATLIEIGVYYTAILRKVVVKVQATILKKVIVGGIEFIVLQGNLKEWHERPWTYVYEC